LNQFTIGVNALFDLMSQEIKMKMWIMSPKAIERTCNFANSVRFDFSKKGFKIVLPKIKNFNLGYNVNE
jgi:hypothetical protein